MGSVTIGKGVLAMACVIQGHDYKCRIKFDIRMGVANIIIQLLMQTFYKIHELIDVLSINSNMKFCTDA